MQLPQEVREILLRLEQTGHRGWAVGGCVRDLLRGHIPHDWDVCTDALPEQTIEAFRGEKIAAPGLAHGTVTLVRQGVPYEITTLRAETGYADGRHPDRVEFVTDLAKDLARRDFTVNAMAMDHTGEVTDCFGGRKDLAAGLLRCVGDPDRRFAEDGLRILRALRFAAVLGFAIHPATSAALHRQKEMLVHVSAERITAELLTLLGGAKAGAVCAAYPDILALLLPGEWNRRLCDALDSLPPDPLTRLCFVRAELGEQSVDGLRLSRMQAQTLEQIASNRHAPIHTRGDLLRLVGQLGWQNAARLLECRKAAGEEIDLAGFARLAAENPCCTAAQLSIDGCALAQLGAKGAQIRQLLRALLDEVIDGQTPNTTSALTARAAALLVKPLP